MAPPSNGDDRPLEAEDGDSEVPTAPSPSRLDRWRPGRRPARTRSQPGPASTKRQIERLDDNERRLSYAAAAASVIIGVVIYLVETGDRNFRVTKGVVTPQTTLVLGILFGALLLSATLFGRRAPMGFMALFTFLAFGTRYLAGVPFLALAVWLLYRSYKFQKAATARVRAAKAESGGSSPSSRRSSSGSTGAKPAAKGSTAKGPGRPEANKRFTPKRPPAPAPKPSRRERKAAQASD
ncbi:MAG TPA: hypothetical protein VII46_02865 [Acidimicrobiales bacterium]